MPHYFSSTPLDEGALRALDVVIAGRTESVLTAPGVFSAGRIDPGTAVLLRTVASGRQHDPAGSPELGRATGPAAEQGPFPGLGRGDLLDLGCGWGVLALTMARLAPQRTVWAVDVNEAARQLTARNAERLGLGNIHALAPEEVPDTIRFARIWSNPPIRVGKTVLHDLLTTWLGRLAEDGWADMVVQRHLGADSLHSWIADQAGYRVERLASAKGFRVLRVFGHSGSSDRVE